MTIGAPAGAGRMRNGAVLGQIAHPFVLRRGTALRAAVGLGTTGYTASLLAAAGLGREAYPFDRVSASPRMIAHCLDDDFATLLAPDHYQPVALERRVDHAWYRDKFGVRLFERIDPTVPGEYAALRASVEAFRATARNRLSTYVVVTPDALLWQKGFGQVSRALRAYAPFTRLVYAVVREAGAHPLPKLGVLAEDEGHVLIELRASSSWEAGGFENPLDDIVLLTAILERL